ncbi:hypothetical protein [Micromonospora sp. NPDC126480]|uniref:hypothetical protein n=1 Tax=Micromonospora sp. NPDC126480 TaxID=3155312 RepID=UPI00332D620D
MLSRPRSPVRAQRGIIRIRRAAGPDRGPDDDVEIEFTGPGGNVELTLRCAGGQPVADPDDD